jgi:hypothetical protein
MIIWSEGGGHAAGVVRCPVLCFRRQREAWRSRRLRRQRERRPGIKDPTCDSVENDPLSSLLEIAYGIGSYQLVGPAWVERKSGSPSTRKSFQEQPSRRAYREEGSCGLSDAGGQRRTEAGRIAGSSHSTLNDDRDEKPAPFNRRSTRTATRSFRLGANISWRSLPRIAPAGASLDESMGHFAEILGGYVHQPVLNATGLTGNTIS